MSPSALTKLPSGSASMRTLLAAPCARPHASIVCASLTDTTITSSTNRRSFPLSLTYPGRCVWLHPGVKAPGTPTSTAFFRSAVCTLVTSAAAVLFSSSVAFGRASPTLIASAGRPAPASTNTASSPSSSARARIPVRWLNERGCVRARRRRPRDWGDGGASLVFGGP